MFSLNCRIALASSTLLLLLLANLGSSGPVEDKYSCPHGWTRYGGKKCLKYANELQDYERAQTTCRSKNQGTLVTIHSHDEQNFVYSYLHSIAASSTPIWLGAKQVNGIDFESILWLDKSENSYTNWAPSEPSHPDEICIAINPRNGMWHDVMCTEANVPACERAPTTQWPFFVAFCSEGWFQFNDEKCVRIISSQALNFYESQELCRSKYNSKLLSIKTDRESEFLHNLIKFRDVKLPVWLGAVQNDFSSFNWIDKSDVTFTNWAEGEPNDPDHACLSMTASGGKWSDTDCKEQKLILCQKAVPEDSSCETGWLQFRQDKCYRFVHIRLAFDDAETLCNNLYGGHLPSIHSQEEQFMISQFLASVNVKNGSEIWLGGRQMDFHNFNWGDGSPFNYSYWEHGEPNFPAEKCIEMSWRNGRWNDINCRLKRAVLCERQVTSRHLIKPNLYQPTTCLDSNNCTAAQAGSAPAGSASVVPVATAAAGADNSGASASAPFELPVVDGNYNNNSTGNSSSLPAIVGPEQSNGTLASVLLINRTNSQSADGETFMLPLPDDKPIKVVSSILHRSPAVPEPQPALVGQFPVLANQTTEALPALLSPSNNSNANFIHYNLPPPPLSRQEETMYSIGAAQTSGGHQSLDSSAAKKEHHYHQQQQAEDLPRPSQVLELTDALHADKVKASSSDSQANANSTSSPSPIDLSASTISLSVGQQQPNSSWLSAPDAVESPIKPISVVEQDKANANAQTGKQTP